ncbi:MAG: phosphoribosylformylglycinamidine cyclo-ligase [Deltaproteobacteria bacterium]|nr:phosphoribosylformylglycinamidine cyclo-ligase [Deltaproteobacteria bacterium]
MSKKITYRDAGVDTDLADRALASVTSKIQSTFTPGVLGNLGGFAAMFRPNWKKFQDPILVSATDGVGTKLKIAFMTGIHNTVGIDLVAMNVNDLLVTGAEPLFFLDYFATGKIEPSIFNSVLSGIAEGCVIAGCALIGGETAEMPDFYPDGEYDLAGFCVGILDRSNALDQSKVRSGDILLGIASSGLHSNGFSLVRKALLEKEKYSLDYKFPDSEKTLGEELLTPTRIYVKPVLSLLEKISVHGMAHITGGGFYGNIPRVLPDNVCAHIDSQAWEIPSVFKILKWHAGLDDFEMFKTFNMGVGMIMILAEVDTDEAMKILRENKLDVLRIGVVKERTNQSDPKVIIK